MEQAEGPVRTRCFCPGTPHEHDVFHLVEADDLPIDAGIAAASAIATVGDGNAGAALIGAFLRHGAIRSWNLVDEDGNLLAVTPANVGQRLSWTRGGMELASAALARYVNAHTLAPFGLRHSPTSTPESSNGGPTADSTSPETSSSPSLPEPSASSSPDDSGGMPWQDQTE